MLFRRVTLSVSIVLLMSGCGGGGSDSSTSQPTGPDSMTSPSTGEQLSKIAEFKVLDVGSELTAGNFGLKTWNPTAMVVNGDVLYIANSQAESNILRYDLKQKRALSAIDPTKISGLAKKWDSLNDLEIQAGRLYVANYGSNRIDVLDINSEQPNFIMALGTGVWWGDALNYALVHSNAVTADDRYVYVPDIEGRINVWRQSDVTAQNHLKARKFARLSLPGCARNCNARMEVIGDYLYTSLPDGMTYVHDINQIQENENNIAPILTETNLSAVMHRHNDGLVYVSRNDGTVESYREKSFNLESILPNKSVDTFRDCILKGQNQSSRIAKASDLYIYGQNLLHMANQKIYILPMLTLQQNKSTQLNQAMILTESKARERSRVLQDGESWETLTNSSQRHVYMDHILSATLNGNRLHLQSYSAVPVRDLQIRAKIKNSEDWVILAKLDQLTPFSNASFDLKLTDQSRFPLLDGTGSIQLAGLSQTTQNPSNIFDLKINSETDEHVKKLNQIKAKWKIYFGTYDEPNKWCRITPVYAREWVMMMTNLAYMLSTPEFETLWFNHKAVMGHDFFGNDGQVEGPNGFFQPEDYVRIYREILNRNEINLGITNMGGGLGGGAVLGVDTWLFYGHYRLSGYRIIAHEFGHHWGGHNSAWAMSNYGFEAIVDWLNFYFQRRPGSIPYMDPNVNAFHLTPDNALCQGVNQNMVKGVASTAPWNKVDEYFKNNPLPNQ
ncbi:beta-propeller fold lactonase family protein [Acinetobacter sp. TWP2-2-3]|uniref:beta-propeller fold lactonase family protein n=1 Tax=unclassified Acinetobacter TaxID=196816 RepID=UPI003CEE9199